MPARRQRCETRSLSPHHRKSLKRYCCYGCSCPLRLRSSVLLPSKTLIRQLALRRSSSLMISISRTGLTSPSTCVMSALSKARSIMKMASTARMCDKKALPSPAPSAAPFESKGKDKNERRRHDKRYFVSMMSGRFWWAARMNACVILYQL